MTTASPTQRVNAWLARFDAALKANAVQEAASQLSSLAPDKRVADRGGSARQRRDRYEPDDYSMLHLNVECEAKWLSCRHIFFSSPNTPRKASQRSSAADLPSSFEGDACSGRP